MSANAINCPVCKSRWNGRDPFIADPSIRLVGYQPDFEELHLGLFLFHHKPCGNTLALPAGLFQDFQSGPVFERRSPAADECPGHCQHKGNFDECPSRCECNYVRTVLLALKDRMSDGSESRLDGSGPLSD